MSAERFGPYRLDELVGRGGMGEVYRAYDTVKDRTVALKRLPRHLADDTGFQRQFRRESQIVARLSEPHIIPIHDFGEIDGQLFIDMRLVEGIDLTTLLDRQGPLPPSRAAGIAVQVASALAAAHNAQLVHRDVKPANVLVSGADRGEDHVYLVDFGIARDTSATEFGPGGAMVGSAEYMAPEQYTDGHADHRIDIYALGGLLYTALTARRPFPVEGAAAQMYAHLHSQPPVPSAQVPGVPTVLDQVVAKAMAKSPEQRHQSAFEFAMAVRAAMVPGGATDSALIPGGAADSGGGPTQAWPLGTGAMRVLGWKPQWRAGLPDMSTGILRRDALDISLSVAEKVSRSTIGAVSETLWSRLNAAMAALQNGSEDSSTDAEDSDGDGPGGDDTVVLTTVFEEGPNRTVIEVRVPVAAAREPTLDLDRILADAYAAASAQTHGRLDGKYVTISPDVSGHGPAVVTVRSADTETP